MGREDLDNGGAIAAGLDRAGRGHAGILIIRPPPIRLAAVSMQAFGEQVGVRPTAAVPMQLSRAGRRPRPVQSSPGRTVREAEYVMA